jgi:hypothetical protein
MSTPALKSLLAKEQELLVELAKVRRAIETLRAQCDHVWKGDGHYSQFKFQKCEKCGKDRRF